MSVKPIRSAARVLEALEIIARHQPIGVADLARQMGEGKSNIQRVLVTLASSGWIKPLPDGPTRWELTSRVQAVASDARGGAGLGQLLRPLMVSLRDQTGETVICAVPDVERVVITDVVESTQLVRSAPPVGLVVPTEESASGRALLAAMAHADRERLVGHALTGAAHAELDAIEKQGWSLSVAGDAAEGSTSVGTAIVTSSGSPIAAVAISGVSSRMSSRAQARAAELLVQEVAALRLPA
jgi:IclR family acetate operon transcriptional repressor